MWMEFSYIIYIYIDHRINIFIVYLGCGFIFLDRIVLFKMYSALFYNIPILCYGVNIYNALDVRPQKYRFHKYQNWSRSFVLRF